MVDDVYMIAVFIVMILIYAMYCVQKTSNKCSNAFIYPDTSMITDWIPFINYENEKKDKKNMDPINDRVNEHYLSSPTYDDMDGMDITQGLWNTTRSHPKVSNDGMEKESAIFDQITPEYLNQHAPLRNELVLAGGLKSRILDFHGEGSNFENPWS